MGGQINVLAATDVKVSANDPESFISLYWSVQLLASTTL